MKNPVRKSLFAILAILILFSPHLPGITEDDHHAYTARNRIYVYFMGNLFHMTHTGMGIDTPSDYPNRIAPLVGAGFSLLNFYQSRAFLNLEADFSQSFFTLPGNQSRRVETIGMMAHFEWRPGRFSNSSIHLGFGLGILSRGRADFWNRSSNGWYTADNSTDATLATELGARIEILPHVILRTGLRFYSYVYESGDQSWDDELEIWTDDFDSELFASSLFLGLEYHF